MVGGKIMNILLLGGIGSGKSEALKILKEEHGANIIEADKVAHFLYEKDRAGYTALKSLFGDIILDNKKDIDRKKLGDILYYDKDKLRKVDEIIHPLVNAEIKRRLSDRRLSDSRLNVVEQALMPDENFYDSVWYLYTDIEIRIKRLILSRGLSRERIETIISKQPNESDFESVADKIIKNNGDRFELEKNIREALR
ncbi:dephospho-CoA kinase [Lachnoanaerobaculum saburreum F0468]|uniref:Dephospho-CoA kinase n=2 Tax=Lachnoanaerobaculum saburreum TaxID=467210 RepID=I0R3U8_9FIRM|nr:dephospho-CoA kinase [Lachnoanaerobaculum saburreum F0468]